MLKQVGYDVVFQEFPDEVTLAISLSLCPNCCVGCHSAYLRNDIGEELTEESLAKMLGKYAGEITCVGFMGGDNDPLEVARLAAFVKKYSQDRLRVGWYSGKENLPEQFPLVWFDYVKLGPWVAARGPLNSLGTNQRLYQVKQSGTVLCDITNRLQSN